MHSSDPADIDAHRPPPGDRIRRRPPPSLDTAAIDQILEEDDGSDAYFESLVQRHSESMAIAIRRAGIIRQEVIEEAIQDAVRKLLELRRAGSGVDDPRAWLVVVATRNAITNLRQQSNRNRIDEQRTQADRDRIDKRWPQSARWESGHGDEELVVRDMIESFPSEHGRIVDMAIEGYSKPEIAVALGISPSTVVRRLDDLARKLAPLYPERRKPKSAGR